MIVRIDYPQPQVRLDLWGGTSGTFAGLDAFGRITDQRWQNNTASTPADVDRYQYGYDRNSNRLYKANVVGGGLDELYAYDPLNRLTQMQRGVLNSAKTGLTGTAAREMDWTLDPTGNGSGYQTKTSGTTDLNQARTSNKVNEVTGLTDSAGPTWVMPAYDAAGNTTTMPQVADPTQGFTATYDAWNRMTAFRASGGAVAAYRYDGRHRRIVKVTAAIAETRHFYWTNAWQDVEERVGTSTAMDVQHVWGVRYVDELVCRDDALRRQPGSSTSCRTRTSTSPPSATPPAWWSSGTSSTPTGCARSATRAGRRWPPAPTLGPSGTRGSATTPRASWSIYNRYRNLHPALGAFAARDVLDYVDDANLYWYVSSNPVGWIDWSGTAKAAAETTPECSDVVILSDEGYWDNRELPKPGKCSAYGVLACFADVFNRQPDQDGMPGKLNPGIIPNWPGIRGPIGIGPRDPSIKASDAEKRHGDQYKLDDSAGAYNAGKGVARDPNDDVHFHDLFKEALGKAEQDATNRAANCDECKCPAITIRFVCADDQAQKWGRALYQRHQADWGLAGKGYKFDPRGRSLCGMTKRIECKKQR